MTGQVLECSLAKPPTEKKSETVLNSQKPLLPTYPLHGYGGMMGVGYGFAGNYGVPAPFGQVDSSEIVILFMKNFFITLIVVTLIVLSNLFCRQ